MRGDVAIIEGKLCYEFDASEEIRETFKSKRGRFFKGVDEWIIYKIDDEKGIAWCYQPMVSTHTSKINKLFDEISWMKADIYDLYEKENARHQKDTLLKMGIVDRIKLAINKITLKLIGKSYFKLSFPLYTEGFFYSYPRT